MLLLVADGRQRLGVGLGAELAENLERSCAEDQYARLVSDPARQHAPIARDRNGSDPLRALQFLLRGVPERHNLQLLFPTMAVVVLFRGPVSAQHDQLHHHRPVHHIAQQDRLPRVVHRASLLLDHKLLPVVRDHRRNAHVLVALVWQLQVHLGVLACRQSVDRRAWRRERESAGPRSGCCERGSTHILRKVDAPELFAGDEGVDDDVALLERQALHAPRDPDHQQRPVVAHAHRCHVALVRELVTDLAVRQVPHQHRRARREHGDVHWVVVAHRLHLALQPVQLERLPRPVAVSGQLCVQPAFAARRQRQWAVGAAGLEGVREDAPVA
eukprot:683142-Rhodomonas_salina.30